MARARFRTDVLYPARLYNVIDRPTENHLSDFVLLRVEFELFELSDRRLVSLNRIASRDLMLFPGVKKDTRVIEYARALGVRTPENDRTWTGLRELPLCDRPWVLIRFGEISKVDYRQPFKDITAFDPKAQGLFVDEHTFAKNAEWIKVGEAARRSGYSVNTVRRKVDAYEPVFGEVLTWHTAGGHRLIHWKLLQVLMNSADPA